MRKKTNRIPTGHSANTTAKTRGKHWIWGTHCSLAALNNPKRTVFRVLHTPNMSAVLANSGYNGAASESAPAKISQALPPGAVHQGLALEVAPLPATDLAEIISLDAGPVIMLDGITDPRNIGAIYRAAAAFGAKAVIAQDRHFPPLCGVLAKAAAGAVEKMPTVLVVNLSRTLQALADAGYVNIGLAGETKQDINQIRDDRPKVLVMGAEGKGIRPNVRKHCDLLARIPIEPAMESLNVASAASVALFALRNS